MDKKSGNSNIMKNWLNKKETKKEIITPKAEVKEEEDSTPEVKKVKKE